MNRRFAKGPLAELIRWSSSAPQILGYTPVGANFSLWLKKKLLVYPTPKHTSKVRSRSFLTWATEPLCLGGQGFGCFLDLR
jgi:hypothetical protein